MIQPIDHAIRQRALDSQSSFIVQAPAGSGKTELLTRRVLTLLARVDEPEEILAITFTRKAASEMRQRVVQMLERAASGLEPDNEYEAEGLGLARNALLRDEERQWRLRENPQRLNMRTIDALATQLAHRLPVTSTLGAPTGVVEDASVIYREVAARFIEAHIQSLDRVLLQVGNRVEQARLLLANLLANRDQWKRHVYAAGDDHDALRTHLEGMLGELVESRLENLLALVPDGFADSLLPRLRMACGFLLEDAEGDLDALSFDMQGWLDMQVLPGTALDDLNGWCSIGVALLTQSSPAKLRKQVDKRSGFPAKTEAKARGVEQSQLESHKQQMLALLESTGEAPEFVAALSEVCSLPYPRYADEQWDLLSQLLGVLPDLLLELQLVFAERGVVDFAELSERAQRALGTTDEPTDLALAMDLSLKHVLVDEFQDTSQTQFQLFEQLVSEWSEGDGRTFFVVGDPMQSIYRFRDGDVALFAQARDRGIGPVVLESLVLSVNFRAVPDLIGWVNRTFSAIFPRRADADTGAVPYSPSAAHLQGSGGVQIHGLLNSDRIAESEVVADIAAEALGRGLDHTVAILVRTRGQASEIFDALRAHSLAYESIDMDLVGERAVVRDLVSLCLALRYPHDRLHWLSLLRAPFVGVTLTDLHALMLDSGRQAALIELMQEPVRIDAMSTDGQARVSRFLKIIQPALVHASRGQLMPWVESVWLQLGGPVVCRDVVDRDAAERALARLWTLEAEGRLWEKSALTETMKSLYAASADLGDCRIQVMTLHKAKGLEFDTVILPALDRQPRSDSSQLLNWFESTLDGHPQLLLAPLEQAGVPGGRRDRINRLVRKARERCDEQEKLRLLYVACTRAKKHLHLTAHITRSTDGNYRPPINASLLRPLWPLLEAELLSSDTHESMTDVAPQTEAPQTDTHQQMSLAIDEAQVQTPLFERLPLNTQFPEFEAYRRANHLENDSFSGKKIEFLWAGRMARDIGTVVHKQLQMLAECEFSIASVDLDELGVIAERQLRNMGVQKVNLPDATKTVLRAVSNTLADQRGRWVLSDHEMARSEWALSVSEDMGVRFQEPASVGSVQYESGVVRQVVIDRTFVDAQGTRWIVDFKTGDHRGGEVEAFLDSEQQRYADQLNHYADIIRRIDGRPIRVGLYFPLLKGWREWEPPLADHETGR